MTLTITIDLDNDTLASADTKQAELQRILADLGERICLDDQNDTWKAKDANGNTVAVAKLA